MSTYSVKKSVAAGISQGSWGDRAAVWVGGIMLIGPLLIWLYGVATGQHFADSVTEMTLVSALFFCPLGLLVMVCGIQNLVPPTSKAAKFMDGLFLMACFFAGPVGILLYIARYIKRRDERSETQLETKSVVPSTDAFIQENRRSNKRVILGVVFGVSLLLSSVLFVQIWQHLNKTEQYWILNWGGKLLVVCGMFIAAYLIKRKAESAAMNNPWKVMGWITTLLAGLLVLSMLMQVNAPGSDEVVIDYDVNYPVMFISTEAGEKKYVRSRPFTFKLPPGKHELVITFKMGDDYRKFTRTIEKIAGKQLKINLAPVIQAYVNYDKNQKLEAAEREKNRGALVLSGQEPGLRVGVFPVDPMQTRSGDGVFGFSDQFFTLETVTHEVPAGKYLIRVSSELTGWEIDGENPKYDLAEIEVKPGTVVPVTITRDYQKLARNHPNWSKGGLFKFRWPDSKLGSRQVYTLSVTDALVVQQLFEAFADGKPDVAEADLLETASTGFNPEKYDSLEQFFKNGKHPAWGKLIVAGKEAGTWRLVEPRLQRSNASDVSPFSTPGASAAPMQKSTGPRKAMGTILFSTEGSGIQIEVKRSQDGATAPDFAMMKRYLVGQTVFEMTEGEYVVEVISRLAGWELDQQMPRYTDSKVTVKPGETIRRTIRIDYHKLAEQHPDWESGEAIEFRWPDSSGKKGVVYGLTIPQGRVVQQLFQAFAEGKPDVSEADLLATANAGAKAKPFESLKDLFDQGDHPAWENLIVAGMSEQTWRLTAPKTDGRQDASKY